MKTVSKFLLIASMVCAGSGINAAPKKLNVDFGFFPAGTDCQVFGTTGQVRKKIKKEIKFRIKGDTGKVSFRCQQPDGFQFQVDTGPLLPDVNVSFVTMQINQSGKALVMFDSNGIRQVVHDGILKPY